MKKNLGHPSFLFVSCTGYHTLADAWDQIKHNKRPLRPIYRKKVICKFPGMFGEFYLKAFCCLFDFSRRCIDEPIGMSPSHTVNTSIAGRTTLWTDFRDSFRYA